MQEVQTRIRLVAPATTARTVCRLMFQRRLETLWAWLILCPNTGPRPHTSHILAINLSSETIQDNTAAGSFASYSLLSPAEVQTTVRQSATLMTSACVICKVQLVWREGLIRELLPKCKTPPLSSGVCKSTEWKGGSLMTLLLLIAVLILRTRRTKFKIELDLWP